VYTSTILFIAVVVVVVGFIVFSLSLNRGIVGVVREWICPMAWTGKR
jgi:hypothetical protein